MVVNFRIRGISRGTRKLTRTATLIKKKRREKVKKRKKFVLVVWTKPRHQRLVAQEQGSWRPVCPTQSLKAFFLLTSVRISGVTQFCSFFNVSGSFLYGKH